MAATYRARGRTSSQLPTPSDELISIERHFEFVNMTFKYTVNDLENIIQMLRARQMAEEAYLNALLKVKRLNFSFENDKPNINNDSQLTFQKAVKSYESIIDDIINSRHILKEKLKLEIDVLVKQKELEEQNRKTYKNKLYESNSNYTMFRNRDIVKLQKSYIHKCEDLKTAQISYEQLAADTADFHKANNSNRNSGEQFFSFNEFATRDTLDSMDPSNTMSSNNKKKMAGIISQMRTMAAGNPLVDQSKQITKLAKMKKDTVDADTEYRDGILVLEALRKKQIKTAEETNRQLKKTIQRKTEIVKTSLINILLSEVDSLQQEMKVARLSYDAANAIDSYKDLQVFDFHYQAQGYVNPTPIRYENYYFPGKCKVLFGGYLETYALEHNRTVPLIVVKCCEAIENMGGLQKEGIYRVSGRQANVEQLKHQFELDEEAITLDNNSYDVFTIATALKLFLRELKYPLFDFVAQSRATYNKSVPQMQRFQLLETKLANLSLAHRSTLHYIIRHLSKVNANSHINKMNIPNLAMIFTPVIFQDFNQTEETMAVEWSPDDLFEDLILYYEVLFPKAEEMARKNNEFKLNQALNGLSPFNKFSQSNLLYLSQSANTALPHQDTNPMLLLTQPMTPPVLPYEQPLYPPKLTTVIGTTPPSVVVHQRSSSMPTNEFISSSNHDIGANTNKVVPPRHDSLCRKKIGVLEKKQMFEEKTLEEPIPKQYQAQFNPDHVLPAVIEDNKKEGK